MLPTYLMRLFALPLCLLAGVSHAAPASEFESRATWPGTPFKTSGRDIISASGAKVVYAGVNWPGHGETMLPEGLQYSSVADMVSKIKSLGMNVIRLTYAIEMVDDYLANSPNQGLKNTLVNGLGQTSGQKVLQQILSKNPSFSERTTRLEVFDAVAAECARQQIWIHLDNHVSKAQWCCGQDANAWFGAPYFDVQKWQRGLGFMANHAKSWTALASMSLRNELRDPGSGIRADPYNWATWYKNAIPATAVINSNNSLPLIFLSGLNYDGNVTALASGEDLGNGVRFNIKNFSYSNKLVYELHRYETWGANNCDGGMFSEMNGRGYGAMNLNDPKFPNHAPVILSEFGYEQSNGADQTAYAQCLKTYLTQKLPGGPGGWLQWVLLGSYYTREGTQDWDETWGLLKKDGSGWRNQGIIDNTVKPFVKATLS